MTQDRPFVLVAALLLAVACTRPAPPASDARPAQVAGPSTQAEAGVTLHDLASTWRDQAGVERTLAGLAAPVRVLALVYTSCTATCPRIVADLKRIEAAVPAARRGDVRFVLVSLDPARDTPGRLAEWARSTRLDPARWTLLNGSDEDVRGLAAALGVRYQRQPDDEVAHGIAIHVLDAAGAVVHQQAGLGGDDGATAAAVARLLR